jgi:hypothetical protein
MTKPKPVNINDYNFYCGIITALAMLAGHDAETYYVELVEMCDLDELIDVAKRNDEIEFSGLKKYGYIK